MKIYYLSDLIKIMAVSLVGPNSDLSSIIPIHSR